MLAKKGIFPLLIISFITLAISCDTSESDIPGFNRAAWTTDTDGCKDQRGTQMAILNKNREKLLGKSQNEIKELLGTPDEHELYERTRKFFYYYLEPSASCEQGGKEEPKMLQIRFNALGISNEVFVKNSSAGVLQPKAP